MMERKVLCPTLHVMLVKTIKAFCEVNLQYNHKVEITGSLHVRSDGEKVFTCLLDEEIVRGQTDAAAASRVAELATRISLANAALTLQHVQGVNHSQQVAEALLFSMQGAVDLNNYFVNPSQSALVAGSDDARTVTDDCLSSNAALRVSPISPAQDRSAVDLSLEDIRQKTIKVSDQMPIIASMPHFTDSHQRPSNRRVETVAKTLAAIKASNASRIEANNAGANQGFPQNHVKLPDIKTLAMAHRLPSYQNARPDEAVMSNAAEVASITGASPILSSLPLASQNSVTDVSLDMGAKPDVGRGAAAPSGQRKKFQCMFCGIFLSTKCYLKNHVNAMHTRSRVYQCELCEHFFYSAGAMRIHKLRNHWQGSKKHRCEHCGENFLLPIELRKHIKKKHFAAASLVETEPAKLEPGEVPASRSQYLCPLYSMPAMTLSQAVLLPSTSMVPMTTEMLLGSDSVTE